MANWKHRCDILKIVHDDELTIREQVQKIADEISKCSGFNDTLFAEYLTELLDLDEEEEVEQEANGVLRDIYDYADENLIWTSG